MRPFPLESLPAAHSMDTTWYAVDADGRVGRFDTGEDGALPGEAATTPEAGRFDDALIVAAEIAIGRDPDAEYREPDLRAGCVTLRPGEPPWIYRAGRVPGRALRLSDLPPDVAAQVARVRFPGRFTSGGTVDLTAVSSDVQLWGGELADYPAPGPSGSWIAEDPDGVLAVFWAYGLRPEVPTADPEAVRPVLLAAVAALGVEDGEPPGAEEDLFVHVDPADPVVDRLIASSPGVYRLPPEVPFAEVRAAPGYRGWAEPWSALHDRRRDAAAGWSWMEWQGGRLFRRTVTAKRPLRTADLPAELVAELRPFPLPVRLADALTMPEVPGLVSPPPPPPPRPRSVVSLLVRLADALSLWPMLAVTGLLAAAWAAWLLGR